MLNQHVKRHLRIALWVSCCLAVIWIGLLALFAVLDPRWALERQLRFDSGKLQVLVTGNVILLWVVVLYEVITDGNLLGRILSDGQACARFLGYIILANAIIYAWN